MSFVLRVFLFVLVVVATAGCIDYSSCTLTAQDDLQQTQGRTSLDDAGVNTIVTLEWPGTTLPVEYFKLGQLEGGDDVARQAFRGLTADAGAVGVVFAPINEAFSFSVGFPEPERTAFVGTCQGGNHPGMADTIVVKVEVGAPTQSGSRSVSSTTTVNLGAL